MLWRIYKYTNIITGQSYIGQTTMNVNERAKKDGKGYGQGTPFREAIDKYSWSNFEQSILRLCTSQEEANQYERHFIEKYNTVYPNGYNLQSGGKKDTQHHELSKKKMTKSRSGKKRQPCSEELKQKISKSVKESMTPKVRQLISERTKEAMSKPEVREKFLEFCRTEDYRQMVSRSKKGNTNVRGKKWFNNGVKNVMDFSCPDGFVPGRVPNITQS